MNKTAVFDTKLGRKKGIVMKENPLTIWVAVSGTQIKRHRKGHNVVIKEE